MPKKLFPITVMILYSLPILASAQQCFDQGLEKLFKDEYQSLTPSSHLTDQYSPAAYAEDEFSLKIQQIVANSGDPELTPLFEQIDEAYRLGRGIDGIKRDLKLYEASGNPTLPGVLEELQAKMDSKLIAINNDFIQKMKVVYDREGIPSKIVDKEGNKVLILDFEAPPGEISAVNFYKKIQEKYELKEVTLSLKDNADNTSQGFYDPSNSRMEIGPAQAFRLLDDYVNSVGKHETRHAIFNFHRSQGLESIFDTKFIGSPSMPLNDKKFYDSYMSAEELYTFSTDLQTLAQAMKGEKLTNKESLMGLLNQINGTTLGLKTIAKTQQEMTEGIYLATKEAIKKRDYSRFQAGELPDESIHLAMADKHGRYSAVNLVTPEHKLKFGEYKKTLEEIAKRKEAFLLENLKGRGVNVDELQSRFPDKLQPAETELLKSLGNQFDKSLSNKLIFWKKDKQEKAFLKIMESRMKDLNRISSIQLEEATKLEVMIQGYVKAKDAATPAQLEKIRKHMFATAKLVKEKYKGFGLKVHPDNGVSQTPGISLVAKSEDASTSGNQVKQANSGTVLGTIQIPHAQASLPQPPLKSAQEITPNPPVRFTIPGTKFTLNESPLDISKELYVGLDDGGHIFLMAGGKRYDGNPLDHGRVRDIKDTTRFRPGAYFGINLSPEKMGLIQKVIEKNADKFTLSCIHGACKVLKQSGIVVEGYKPGVLLRIKPVLTSISEGKIKVDGVPVEVKSYVTSDVDLQKFMALTTQNMKRIESEAFSLYGGPAATVGGFAVAAGAGVYHYFTVEEEPE